MATGGSPGVSSNKQTCAICLERYRRPKLLPCFHTFCLTCLQSLAPPPAPSLTCPACRAVVVIPTGGAELFQSNFYLEDELVKQGSRACDVCDESRDASFRCVECQQYYCTPCRSLHDKMATCKHHTMQPFSATSAVREDTRPLEARMCPKHDMQRQIFHCTVCDVMICTHCKLTSHNDHDIEDLADTATRARTELLEMLQQWQEGFRQLEVQQDEADKTRKRLEGQMNHAEESVKERANDVIQWAERALSDTNTARRALEEELNERDDDIEKNMNSLTAMIDHVTLVLSSQNNPDVIKLRDDVKARTSRKPAERIVDVHNPVAVTYQPSENEEAVNSSSVAAYIGKVALSRPSLSNKVGDQARADGSAESESLKTNENDNGKPSANAGDTQVIVKAAALEDTHTVDPYTACFQRQPLPESAKNCQTFRYANNADTTVACMVLTTSNKLWVSYRPPYTKFPVLKLFDINGTHLRTWISGGLPKGPSLACVGDTLLSPLNWVWLQPSGKSGGLDNTPNDWALCSKSLPPHVVLKSSGQYKVHRLKVVSLHPLKVDLLPVSEDCIKLEKEPCAFDANADGSVFAFLLDLTVELFSMTEQFCPNKKIVMTQLAVSTVSNIRPSYSFKSLAFDICFVNKGKNEMMAFTSDQTYSDHTVSNCHVLFLDHEDGFHRLNNSETRAQQNVCGKFVSHNTGGMLWMGCKGGEMYVKNLNPRVYTVDQMAKVPFV